MRRRTSSVVVHVVMPCAGPKFTLHGGACRQLPWDVHQLKDACSGDSRGSDSSLGMLTRMGRLHDMSTSLHMGRPAHAGRPARGRPVRLMRSQYCRRRAQQGAPAARGRAARVRAGRDRQPHALRARLRGRRARRRARVREADTPAAGRCELSAMRCCMLQHHVPHCGRWLLVGAFVSQG